MTHEFSIGELASRAGVTPNLLRTWENRFGFPAGVRTDSGHRRFNEGDVELVRRVLQARDAGTPLQMAIGSVMQRRAHAEASSVHAALVKDFPHLRPQRMSRRALLAASHAIEDEALARAERPVVLGAFQDGHRFEQSRQRWDELARTATWAAVVADFEGDVEPDPTARPARVHLPQDSPMRREWTVVTLSPTFAAVLSAWEIPSSRSERDHDWEAVISTGRAATVAAARVILGVVRSAGGTPPEHVEDLLAEAAPRSDTASADADRMWARALAHLDTRA